MKDDQPSSSSCLPSEEEEVYGDVLELLRHPRPDVCHQALHAAVQCSSQPSFVVYLRHCIKREQETKEGGIGTPSVRRDAKSFSRRVLGLLGSDVDDGALSAAAVEILINLSADDVLADYILSHPSLHTVDRVIDNLHEQQRKKVPAHPGLSLMLLLNLSRRPQGSQRLLDTQHDVPGFNATRLIPLLEDAATNNKNARYWTEEGFFLLSIFQNLSSLKEGRSTFLEDEKRCLVLSRLLSLLPVVPPSCHTPLVRFCLNCCLDKTLHSAISSQIPSPTCSSYTAGIWHRCEARRGKSLPAVHDVGEDAPSGPPGTEEERRRANEEGLPQTSARVNEDAGKSGTKEEEKVLLSDSIATAASSVDSSPGVREGNFAVSGACRPEDAPCTPDKESASSIVLSLCCFLYPSLEQEDKRAYPDTSKATPGAPSSSLSTGENGGRRGVSGDRGKKKGEKEKGGSGNEERRGDRCCGGNEESEAAGVREEGAGEARREKEEEAQARADDDREHPSAGHCRELAGQKDDGEVLRLRFLHPLVNRGAYGPVVGSVLTRKLVIDCFAALASTPTGRNALREAGVYEVLRCVHLLEEDNSVVREAIEDIVHLLVYSEEELEEQDRQLLASSKPSESREALADNHVPPEEDLPAGATPSSA